jgi:hypothetical protein
MLQLNNQSPVMYVLPQATRRIGPLWVLCVRVYENERMIHHNPSKVLLVIVMFVFVN